MDRQSVIRQLRRGSFVVLAVLSTLVAVAMIWVALNPERVGATPTPALLIILSMLCLPGLTVAAWHWDRANRIRLNRMLGGDADQPKQHPAGRSRPHAAPPSDAANPAAADEPAAQPDPR